MATRITVYAGLACQRERKRHAHRRETPPRFDTLKLVLFHGDGRWTASLYSPELHGEDGPVCYAVVVPRPLGLPDPVLHDLPELVLGLGRSLTREQMDAELVLTREAVDLAGRPDVDRVVVKAVRNLLRLRGYPEELITRMETMHAAVEVFQRSWRETERKVERRGVEKGRREGRHEGRRRLCRMAARKFDAETVRELAALLDGMADPGLLDEAADAVMDCDESEELLRAARRLANGGSSAR